MLKTNNFGGYLSPGQKKIFFEEYDRRPAQFAQIFQEVDTENRIGLPVSHLQGFGLWNRGEEGSTIPQSPLQESFLGAIFTERYHKGYSISWELFQDDHEGVLNGTRGNGGSARMLARGLRGTVETVAANVLSNGFTQIGFDGRPLFHAQHPFNAAAGSASGSNLVTGALSATTLRDACRLLRAQRDSSGTMAIGAVPEKLIVHADNEFTARGIMLNNFDTAEAKNNKAETVPNMQIVVMDYLTDARNWFVKAQDIDNLFFVWRERPTFGSEKIQQSMDWFYYGYARFGAGHADWRGLVGSRGV